MARPRNWHALNAILRHSVRFPIESDTEVNASEWECPQCGEWLDTDGECEDCDHDDSDPR